MRNPSFQEKGWEQNFRAIIAFPSLSILCWENNCNRRNNGSIDRLSLRDSEKEESLRTTDNHPTLDLYKMSQTANDEFSQHLSDEESNHEDASDTGAAPKQQQQVIPQTTLSSNIKLPILKKEEKVIQNGNSKKRISTGKDGIVREYFTPVTRRDSSRLKRKDLGSPIKKLEGLEKGYDKISTVTVLKWKLMVLNTKEQKDCTPSTSSTNVHEKEVNATGFADEQKGTHDWKEEERTLCINIKKLGSERESNQMGLLTMDDGM
ncbi:hypothetical protein Tco_1015759 [Tanacetum coccineum]|uniref:Uncharacterized protein n=1 Tax=Tanacetum coccineum TaxID=301880 RepID=A0ABQ5FMS9_9ASTR